MSALAKISFNLDKGQLSEESLPYREYPGCQVHLSCYLRLQFVTLVHAFTTWKDWTIVTLLTGCRNFDYFIMQYPTS